MMMIFYLFLQKQQIEVRDCDVTRCVALVRDTSVRERDTSERERALVRESVTLLRESGREREIY
jgi:hypothetical protein